MNPDINCFGSRKLYSIDQFTTKSFVLVTAVVAAHALDITQFTDQVIKRLVFKLINGISRVLHKLLNSFHVSTISTYFVHAAGGVHVVFALNLNGSVILSRSNSTTLLLSSKTGSSLLYCHKLPLFEEILLLYSSKISVGITKSRYFVLSTCMYFISYFQSVNGAKL